MTPVTGTVKLAGKPISDVTVWFVPRQGTPANGAVGTTDADGNYKLATAEGYDGVPPGQYDVSFSKFAMPDGSPVPTDVQPDSVGAKQVLPNYYTDPNTSNMSATVPATATKLDFSLNAK